MEKQKQLSLRHFINNIASVLHKFHLKCLVFRTHRGILFIFQIIYLYFYLMLKQLLANIQRNCKHELKVEIYFGLLVDLYHAFK
jgi:hypothetical protein